MTPEALEDTLTAAGPLAETGLALEALWWAGKGDWARAHGCAQQRDDAGCHLVHAYLRRVKGDTANASHWYRRAGRSLRSTSLKSKWKSIAEHLLGRAPS